MYRTLRQCVDDLAATRQLVRIDEEIDANLEAAEIHRRVNRAGGPALHFARVKGCAFPMVSNLFGTLGRARYIFRDSLDSVRRLIEMKIDPRPTLKSPVRWLDTGRTALTMLPKRVTSGPVMAHETTIDKLPQLKCWPNDGGAFITLPAVYTENLDQPGWRHSNLGMYRIQLSGGQYRQNEEVGMHYQIHRGIGVHHTAAVRRAEPLRVNIFVGGTPAMMLAAVMPLPEGMSELSFAGAWRDTVSRSSITPTRASVICPSTPKPISASPARSNPAARCPKDLLATIWDITALHTPSRCSAWKRSTTDPIRFGPSPSSAARRKKTRSSVN